MTTLSTLSTWVYGQVRMWFGSVLPGRDLVWIGKVQDLPTCRKSVAFFWMNLMFLPKVFGYSLARGLESMFVAYTD
jgi:hypothetical protein